MTSSRLSTATIKPFEDVGAGLGLFQFVAGAAGDDVLLVADVVANERLEAKLHGLAVRRWPPC